MKPIDMNSIKFDDNGLVPAIIQDVETQRVIMFAWMNQSSLLQSLELGETVFFSRSRNEIWHKGATSGNTQAIHSVQLDCDSDVLLFQVKTNGPACHTGNTSCFDSPGSEQ